MFERSGITRPVLILKPIVANGCCGAQPLFDIARIQFDLARGGATRLRCGLTPHSREAIRLQFDRDRGAVCPCATVGGSTVGQPENVLYVMTEFVRDDVSLREIAGRAEAAVEFVKKSNVEIDFAIRRAIERTCRGLRKPASGVDRITEKRDHGSLVARRQRSVHTVLDALATVTRASIRVLERMRGRCPRCR